MDYANQFQENKKLHQLLMTEQDQNELKSVSSIEDVFIILSKYWTFLEHEMLVSIVDHHGGNKKLLDYRTKLKQFLEKRRVSELTPLECTSKLNTELSKTHNRIVLKLNEKDPSWGDIVDLKEAICCILNIQPQSALLIKKIEEGCIQVTFYILRCITEEILEKPLTVKQVEALHNETCVMSLSVMDEKLLFTVTY